MASIRDPSPSSATVYFLPLSIEPRSTSDSWLRERVATDEKGNLREVEGIVHGKREEERELFYEKVKVRV